MGIHLGWRESLGHPSNPFLICSLGDLHRQWEYGGWLRDEALGSAQPQVRTVVTHTRGLFMLSAVFQLCFN